MKKHLPLLNQVIKIVIHILFWVIVYFFYTYFLGYGSSDTQYVNKFSAFLMPITISISYFFLTYLIPQYLLKNKQVLFILYSIYTFIISTFFIIISILYGLVFLIDLKSENTSPLTKTLPFIILGVYFIVFIVIIIGLIIHNYKSTIKNEDLKNKYLQTQLQLKEQELKFLKIQIHPHFLFNSLNTIYGFALKKRDEAPEMILKLSNLLDYILYQVEKPVVLLQDEINHLLDYISLEKMRFHDTLHINFEKKTFNKNTQIAPMLLIPFVENSFKHGSIVNGQLQVDITLLINKNELYFKVVNSAIQNKTTQIGIGLKNIQKRLEMLYPKMHTIIIEHSENKFIVEFKLTINGLKSYKHVN